METKVALMIVYNHRFDKNIPILNKHYMGKFSHVFHIVPFYDGFDENVIPVYASSYHFQSYIAQAYTHLRGKGFSHYFIVADDMVLNPKISETTLWDIIGIDKDDCLYPTDFWILQNLPWNWSWMNNILHYDPYVKGVEVKNILPTFEEAEKKFQHFGIPTHKIPFSSIYKKPYKELLLHLPCIPYSRRLKYPLVAGYSDIFMVTDDIMDRFCQYCGVFAATNLFVESAIPTALVLSSNKIKFDKDIKLHYGALWNNELLLFEKKYVFSLEKLIKEFPSDKLFIHPVKLSKWR